MSVVIGTAGHIDHGKTTLLRALTGIDADRLPEERRRGMTIDVGYAHLVLDDGSAIDFVDVPGHADLIGNMLVGAGEIDAALLVVAADDGIRAQTLEHVALLDALAIRDAIVAITKVDLAAAPRVDEVVEAVDALVGATSLRGAPIVSVSGTTGWRLDALRAALAALADRVAARRLMGMPGPPRLAVDRVFPVRGLGPVATGSLRGGSISVGELLRLEPAGLEIRVRGLQVRHQPVEVADVGRTAVALAGVDREALARGDVLTRGAGVIATDRLLVSLARPASLGPRETRGRSPAWPPADGTILRLHLGTAAVTAAVGRRGREGLNLPDGRSTALLRLGEPIATFRGDRAVLRRPSPGDVVAGVRVLDPVPARGISRRRATPERIAAIAAAVDEADADATLDAVVALHGLEVTADGHGIVLAPDVREALEREAIAAVMHHHAGSPVSIGLPAAQLLTTLRTVLRRLVTLHRAGTAAVDTELSRLIDDLVSRRRLARAGDRLIDPARPAGPPAPLAAAMDRLVAALDVPGPPPLAAAARAAGCSPEGLHALQAAGRIVRVEADLAWSAAAYAGLEATALALARERPLTPAVLRDATGTSRRTIVPFLEDLGRRGVLARTPAGHVPGPHAPREPAAAR